jgi:hypothetical protein
MEPERHQTCLLFSLLELSSSEFVSTTNRFRTSGTNLASSGDEPPVARDPEGAMLHSLSDNLLTDQLFRLAREPDLRAEIYERLGEYCHQCRNRLNSLKLSLYLVMRQSPGSAEGRWAAIDRHYKALERRVDEIQTLCRPFALSKVTLGLDLLIEDRRKSWGDAMSRSGKTLEFNRPSERAVASFDVERLGKSLDDLVTWRAGDPEAGSSARVHWWQESGSIHFLWEESGMPSSLAKGSEPPDPATWTLPLLARVVLAHEGDIRVQNDGPYRVELSWPTGLSSP